MGLGARVGVEVRVVLGHRLQRPALQQEWLEARVGGELLPLLRRSGSVVRLGFRVGCGVQGAGCRVQGAGRGAWA